MNNDYSIEPQDDDNNDLAEIFFNEFPSNMMNENFEKLEISCALLAAYFSGRMTQNALSINLQLFNIILNNKLPKNFNELCNTILQNNNDKIDYKKTWYCCSCKKTINPDNKRQRKCNICNDR